MKCANNISHKAIFTLGLSFFVVVWLLPFARTAHSQPQNPPSDRLLPGDMDPIRAWRLPEPSYPVGPSRFESQPRFSYGRQPAISQLLEEITQAEWVDWLERLSGAKPVTVGGTQTTIQTRYSYAMFAADRSNARAYPYVLDQVKAWVPPEQIEEDLFTFSTNNWKNVIVTLPGTTRPDEVVILCAHLDSYSNDPWNLAPGAEDNGSGSATLLQAAHVLSKHKYERTIRLIWFTGEEQGLYGSAAYLAHHPNDNIVGAINLDMFGYDSDHDRCFELHVGRIAASNTIGQYFVDAIADYQINLAVDYLTDEANTSGSDHASFWARGIGAVLVLENYSGNRAANGCGGRVDRNPNYHKTTDTTDKMSLDVGFDIARAALATLAAMSGPLESLPAATTLISPSGAISTPTPTYIWNAVGNSTGYYLWVSDSTGKAEITARYTAAEAGCESGSGTCSVSPTSTLSAGLHTWWIQTSNSAGDGPWSNGMTFVVGSVGLPAAASLISPAGTITTDTPAFTWNAVGNSSWYYLWVNGPSGNPILKNWYTAADAGCGSGAGTCVLASPITMNTGQHTWWIRTWNSIGCGPWSDGLAFAIGTGMPPGKATLISPNRTTSPSPTYSWNAVGDATWYLLWVNDGASTPKIQTWYTAEQAGCAAGTAICSVTPSVMLVIGSCQWWVQTWNNAGLGPWSDPLIFIVSPLGQGDRD
jgi:hypothetical protein